MPWFKVDDALALHMKAITAGNTALGLWVRAGSWSMHQLSDGFIPQAIVVALGGSGKDSKSLIDAGLWESAGGGFQFHDWAKYQPTREQVLAEREAAAERMRRVRANKHPNERANEQRTNGDRSASPSRPVPSPDLTKTSQSQSPPMAGKDSTDSEVSPTITRAAKRQGITNLAAIATAVRRHADRGIDEVGSAQVANWIIDKAKTYPDAPQRYVVVTIERSPFEVQQFIDDMGIAS